MQDLFCHSKCPFGKSVDSLESFVIRFWPPIRFREGGLCGHARTVVFMSVRARYPSDLSDGEVDADRAHGSRRPSAAVGDGRWICARC